MVRFAPQPRLVIGDKVEVFGLQGARELNGRRGAIVKFVGETSRFGVMLEGEVETKLRTYCQVAGRSWYGLRR